jgi:chemotaxis protein CheD
MAARRIEINMGGGAVACWPDMIVADGIGSCVVLSLYDGKLRIGGLAHIMLPDSEESDAAWLPYQCADRALSRLLGELRNLGAHGRDLVARMAGGARMFANGAGQGIGELNIASVRRLLMAQGIPLVGEDVGGSRGRRVEFYLDSGQMIIRFVGEEVRII